MYGKIFDSIYDGTLRANWQALVTFQQLIILADKDGFVDMTPHAIHGRTGIPFDIIEAGLEHLSKPDPHSRSNTEDGRRIVLLDEHRQWGWRLVNHAYYNKLRSAEEKRQADRQRITEKREKLKLSHDVANCSSVSHDVADVAPVAVAVTVEPTPLSGKPDDSLQEKNRKYKTEAIEALDFLNLRTGKAFRKVDSNLKPIESILKSGIDLQDLKTVTMRKINDWSREPKMVEFLRPSTLYRRSNFEQYYGQTMAEEEK